MFTDSGCRDKNDKSAESQKLYFQLILGFLANKVICNHLIQLKLLKAARVPMNFLCAPTFFKSHNEEKLHWSLVIRPSRL